MFSGKRNEVTLFKVENINPESGIITRAVKINHSGSTEMGFAEIQEAITKIPFNGRGTPIMLIPERFQGGYIGDESVIRIMSVFTAQPPNSIFRLDDSMWFFEERQARLFGIEVPY